MLILEDIIRVTKLEAAYGERKKAINYGIARSASLQKYKGKTGQISTVIGHDPQTGE